MAHGMGVGICPSFANSHLPQDSIPAQTRLPELYTTSAGVRSLRGEGKKYAAYDRCPGAPGKCAREARTTLYHNSARGGFANFVLNRSGLKDLHLQGK